LLLALAAAQPRKEITARSTQRPQSQLAAVRADAEQPRTLALQEGTEAPAAAVETAVPQSAQREQAHRGREIMAHAENFPLAAEAAQARPEAYQVAQLVELVALDQLRIRRGEARPRLVKTLVALITMLVAAAADTQTPLTEILVPMAREMVLLIQEAVGQAVYEPREPQATPASS
jgi:hypothetical protein